MPMCWEAVVCWKWEVTWGELSRGPRLSQLFAARSFHPEALTYRYAILLMYSFSTLDRVDLFEAQIPVC